MKKASVPFVGFLQALGLTIYCSLIGSVIWKGNSIFGNMDNFLGPILFLSLFVVSALICALIAGGYPFLVFWDKKNTKEALSIVFYTVGWLALIVLLFMAILLIF